MKKIGVINGPNLDRLGEREPSIYGHQTLQDLEAMLKAEAKNLGMEVFFFQSNHEGDLIDKIGEWSKTEFEGIVINPAAYTHTSVALHDAIAASGIDFIEVHISNIYAREEFRRKSLTAPACKGSIAGLGFEGYRAALQFLS